MNIQQEVVSLNDLQDKVVFSKRNLLVGSNRVTLYESGQLCIRKGYIYKTPYHLYLRNAFINEKTRSFLGFHHINLVFREKGDQSIELQLPWLFGTGLEEKVQRAIERGQTAVSIENNSSVANIRYSRSGCRALLLLVLLTVLLTGAYLIHSFFAPTFEEDAPVCENGQLADSLTMDFSMDPVDETADKSFTTLVTETIKQQVVKMNEDVKALLPGTDKASDVALSSSITIIIILVICSFIPSSTLIKSCSCVCFCLSLGIGLFVMYQEDFNGEDLVFRLACSSFPLLFSIIGSCITFGIAWTSKNNKGYGLVSRLGNLIICLITFIAFCLVLYGDLNTENDLILPYWYPDKIFLISRYMYISVGVAAMCMCLLIGALMRVGRVAALISIIYSGAIVIIYGVRCLFYATHDIEPWIPVGFSVILFLFGMIVFIKSKSANKKSSP